MLIVQAAFHTVSCKNGLPCDWFAGTTSVRATLLKDGHTFSVHVLDPQLNARDVDRGSNSDQTTEQKLDADLTAQDVNDQLQTDGKFQFVFRKLLFESYVIYQLSN